MLDLSAPETRWSGVREVMGMSGPIILGSLSFTIMLFIDNVMVARLGTDALAAMGSAGLWSYILGCFILGVVGCVSTFVSQSMGREALKNCGRYAWQGLYVSMLAGVLAFILWPLSAPLFHAMPHMPEVIRLETIYFEIRLPGYLLTAWITALAAFFQGIGRPAVPMAIGIIADLSKTGLNYLLIYGHFGFPKWGIAGAGVATLLALALQAGLLMAVFLSPPINEKFASRSGFRFDAKKSRELLRVGLPVGAMFFMDVFNWGIFTSFLVGSFGAIWLASHNAAMSFMYLCFMPAVGLNQGIAAIVGYYIGKRRFDRAFKRTYTAIKIAMAYMIMAGLVFATFGGHLIATFFSSDPEVINLGHKLLILSAAFQAFDAINIIAGGALRGAGDTRWMAGVTFLLAYGLFLPLAIFLAFPAKLGAMGAWYGATAYIILLAAFLFTRFARGHWQHIRLFSEDTTQA